MNLIRLRWVLVVFPVLLLLSFVFAEGTRTWEQSKFDELIKGTAKGVAVRSTGGLELAPAFTALSTTPSTYIWSIAADRAGNLLCRRRFARARVSNYPGWQVYCDFRAPGTSGAGAGRG